MKRYLKIGFMGVSFISCCAYAQQYQSSLNAAGTIDLWTLAAMAMGVVLLRRLLK